MSQVPDFTAHGYRVDAVLGVNPEGGRTAYRGVRLSDDAAVVIKRFSFANAQASWETYQEHQRELEMLQGLSHPRIPAYLADFQTDDGFCMVQEFCTAPAMADRRTWTPDQVAAVAQSALELLVHLQDRVPPVAHRDIKPENILVDDDGNAFLVDFGLARADRAQATTLAVGTPGYMPPEQLLGHALTTATDLYGLGAALMSALTGTPSGQVGSLVDSAFQFDMSKLPSNLSKRFRKWLGKMVAPSLDKRFGSAKEAMNALKQVGAVMVTEEELRARAEAKARKKADKQQRKRQPQNKAQGAGASKKQKGRQRSSAQRPSPKANTNAGKLFAAGSVAVLALVGGLFYTIMVVEPAEREKLAEQEKYTRGFTCTSKMVVERDLVMAHNSVAVKVKKGCDLTVRNANVKGQATFDVSGGALRLENVNVDSRNMAVSIYRAGKVTIVGSTLKFGVGCQGGSVDLVDTVVNGDQGAISASGECVVTAKDSTLRGNTFAVKAFGAKTRVSLDNSKVVANKDALLALRGGAIATKGGAVEGGIVEGDDSTIIGLDTAKVSLGAGAGPTWSRVACAPALECIEKVGILGEFIADFRLPVAPGGKLGAPEYLQKKLDPKVEACIAEEVAKVVLPAPDDQPHTLRCTTNGSVMAGGGGLKGLGMRRSVNFRMEK